MFDRPVTPAAETRSDEVFQCSGITLHRGDVLQLASQLQPNSVDAVIADPPYCSGASTTAQRTADPVKKYCQNGNSCGRPTFAGDSRDQRSLAYWSTLWLSACRDVAKESAYCLVFTDWRQIPTFTDALQAAGWTWRGVIAWNKGRGSRSPHKGYFRHQCEYVVWGTNGSVPRLNDRGPFDGCYTVPNKLSDKHHITGKPTALMRELVKVAPPGGTVLDPFAGSATTLVAAHMEGRKSIGFEISPDYWEIGRKRIKCLQPEISQNSKRDVSLLLSNDSPQGSSRKTTPAIARPCN